MFLTCLLLIGLAAIAISQASTAEQTESIPVPIKVERDRRF